MGAGCVEGTAQAARDATEEEAFPMAHVTAMATFLTNAESAVARASPRASATAGGGSGCMRFVWWGQLELRWMRRRDKQRQGH